MERDELFVRTLDDLASRVRRDVNEYDLLHAAALIRKLLLDADPLAHQVNRARQIKLEFDVLADDLVLPPGLPLPLFHARYEGISPRLAPPGHRLRRERVSLDRFLGMTAVRINGAPVTVRDIVMQVAHVEGGVHAGSPKDAKQKALAGLNAQFVVGAGGAIVRTIRGIGDVVLDGLQPLVEAVRASRQRRLY